MTTEAAAIETVSAYVKEQWEAASFSLPVPGAAASVAVPPLTLMNEPYVPPTSGATFAFARVKMGESRQRSMGAVGARKFERQAVLELQLALPAGEGGAAPMARVRHVLRAALEGVRLDGLQPFLSEKTRREFTDGRMSFAQVEFPFSFLETK